MEETPRPLAHMATGTRPFPITCPPPPPIDTGHRPVYPSLQVVRKLLWLLILINTHANSHRTFRHWLLLLCCLHVIVTLLQHLFYWRHLPQRVATHFGPGGEPNDWMDRTSSVLVSGGFQLFFPLLLVSVVRLLRWIPNGFINIPHREYWLAPERRESSLEWLELPMAGIAGLVAALMMVLSHLTFRANAGAGKLEEFPFFVCLAMHLGGTAWLVIRILRHFGRVPQRSGEDLAAH